MKIFLAGILCATLIAAPHLPGAGKLNLGGSANAQQAVDVDFFYDRLDAYGQWVWHPRFGYVWLPERVSESWRPYTVGHWVYTDEYGWYWDSYEPFAWAVYHYGRWGYDQDYGWFWVPGDTWAPAWVQWRYSDNYTGWAPIGPSGSGYAYGAPVNYDPPVAESWVFVQPRYMTSRTIYHYALPVASLNIAFLGATNVYRPVYRTGVVFNFGIPRERVVRVVRRPIIVQKVVKVTNVTYNNKTVINRRGGIRVFAPGVAKGAAPRKNPRRFADNPADFRPKAKLKNTLKGDGPKDFGPRAASVRSVREEVGPEGFKRKDNIHKGVANPDKGNFSGQGGGDRGKISDKERAERKDHDQRGNNAKGDGKGAGDKGKANAAIDRDQGGNNQGANKQGGKGDGDSIHKGVANPDRGDPSGQGGGDRGKISDKERAQRKDNDPGKGQGGGGGGQGKEASTGGGGGQGAGRKPDNGPGPGVGKKKKKEFGAREQGPGGPGGPGKMGKGQAAAGGPDGAPKGQGGQGGGGNQAANKAAKCKKNPDLPACKNQ